MSIAQRSSELPHHTGQLAVPAARSSRVRAAPAGAAALARGVGPGRAGGGGFERRRLLHGLMVGHHDPGANRE